MAKTPQPESQAEGFRNFIAPVAQLVAVLVAVGGVIFWGFKLQEKVERLEAQLQALAASPVISRPNPQAGEPGQPSQVTEPNPLLQTCADLASRLAAAYEKPALIATIAGLESLIRNLGCEGLAKPR